MGEHARLRPCCEHEHPLSPHCWACDGVTDDEEVEPVTPEDFINANMPMTEDPMTPRALPDEAVAALAEALASRFRYDLPGIGGVAPSVDAEHLVAHLAGAGWHLARQAPDGAATVTVEDVANRLLAMDGWNETLATLDAGRLRWKQVASEYRAKARRLLGVGDRAGDGGGRG